MKVTIITAVYNNPDCLRAVESVLSQTYADLEYLVIDGCSTDGTSDLLRSVTDSRMRYYREADTGLFDALNKGIVRATGEVIGHLHSDDLFSSINVVSEIAGEFQRRPVDLVYGDIRYVRRDRPGQVVRNWVSGSYSRDKLAFGWMPAHTALFARKTLFDKHGTYDTAYRISADYDFVLRVFSDTALRVAYVPSCLVLMSTGGNSNRIGNYLRKWREDYAILRRHGYPAAKALVSKNLRKIGQFFRGTS